MKKKEMLKRARKAAVRYMRDDDFKVIDEDFMGFIVSRDYRTLVFTKLVVNVGAFTEVSDDRSEFEQAMMMWLLCHDDIDIPIRYDEISLAVAGEEKAGLRYCRRCC